MGEHGAFRALRLRTVARVGRGLALAEDATLRPETLPARSLASFDDAGAAVSVLALGAWAAAEPGWWQPFARHGVVGGASRLRSQGTAFRALCPALGDALALLSAIEQAARGVLATVPSASGSRQAGLAGRKHTV
jgi:hypothetical protein